MDTTTNVIVFRFASEGDIVTTLPVVEQTAKQNTNHKFVIVTTPLLSTLFAPKSNLKAVGINIKSHYPGVNGLIKLFKHLYAAYSPTMVIDLQGSFETRFLGLLFKVKGVTVETINNGATSNLKSARKHINLGHRLPALTDRYADTFRRSGFLLELPTTPKRKIFNIPKKILDIAGGKQGRWIGISPFADDKSKNYPIERMERIIAEIDRNTISTIFLFDNNISERLINQEIAEKYRSVISIGGILSLTEEAELISNLDCMVTMDSAAMHIASMYGVKTISIWGSTHPCSGNIGYGQNIDDAIRLDCKCQPCTIDKKAKCKLREDKYKCMSQISPEAILHKIFEQ